MTRDDALAIVTAVEESASSMNDWEDHAYRVAAQGMYDLADRLRAAFEVPACTCRYGHDEGTYPWADENCPRRGWAV